MTYEIPAAVQRWLDVLRSDTYKQGRKALRPTRETFCCLGVACDLLDPDVWDTPDRLDFWTAPNWGAGGSEVMDPAVWQSFVGQEASYWLSQTTLADMNDSGCYSFDQLADYIEAQYKKANS